MTHGSKSFTAESGFVTSEPLNYYFPYLTPVEINFPDDSSKLIIGDDGLARYFNDNQLISRTQFAETTVRTEAEVFEVGFSQEQVVWIVEDNAARKIVKYRGPLHNEENTESARQELQSVSPYGDGDWAEETFIVYPDGNLTRTIKIWSTTASEAHAGLFIWGKENAWNNNKTLPVFEVHERVIKSDDNTIGNNLVEVFGRNPVILLDSNGVEFQPDWQGSPDLHLLTTLSQK